MIDVNKNPSPRDQFWFAVLFAIFMGGVGALLFWYWSLATAAYAVWGAGSVVLLAFIAVPKWRIPLYLGWIYLFFPIGYVMSHVVMGLTYYLVLSPIGLLMRLFGKDPMRRKWDPSATTYWVEREPVVDSSRYFRQF